jgi:glycosyltransferase involved in cell wall biosynthesis
VRILFITPNPPNETNRRRAHNILKYLCRRHEIHLVSFVSGPEERRLAEAIRPMTASIQLVAIPRWRSYFQCAIGSVGRLPLEVVYFGSRKMRAVVRGALREVKPDLVYAKRMRMAPYGVNPSGPPNVLDLTDSMALQYERRLKLPHSLAAGIIWTIERKKARRYEVEITKEYSRTIVCSDVDRDYMLQTDPGARVDVIRNGVDTEFVVPQDIPRDPKTSTGRSCLGFGRRTPSSGS